MKSPSIRAKTNKYSDFCTKIYEIQEFIYKNNRKHAEKPIIFNIRNDIYLKANIFNQIQLTNDENELK
jgi:hypothetical protein